MTHLFAFILLFQSFQFFGPRTDAGCVLLRTEAGVTLFRFGSKRSTIRMRDEELSENGWACTAFRSPGIIRVDCTRAGRTRRVEVRCGTDHPVARGQLQSGIRLALFCSCNDRRDDHID